VAGSDEPLVGRRQQVGELVWVERDQRVAALRAAALADEPGVTAELPRQVPDLEIDLSAQRLERRFGQFGASPSGAAALHNSRARITRSIDVIRVPVARAAR